MPYRRRRIIRKKRSGLLFPLLKLCAVVFVIAIAGNYAYKHYVRFNPEDILENSVLKEKNFASKAVEVVSPRHKIKAYLIEDSTNPIISMSFMFKGAGRASEEDKEQGIANFVAAMLTEGAGNLNAQAFKEALEDNAIGIGFSASTDDFLGNLTTIKENQETAYNLLKDVLYAPQLSSEDLERLKKQTERAFLLQKEHPKSILNLAYAQYLYKDHPYGRNPLGREENIKSITPSDLQSFIRTHFAQNNLIIGVAGDISPQELAQVLDNVFGGLPASASINFVRNPDIDFTRPEKNINYPHAGQNIGQIAAQGVARKDADFYPLYVANYIFGGSGLSSRLSKAAREDKGLTYSIYTYMSLADKSPLIEGGFSSTPDKFDEVKHILQQEWERFGKEGASAEEVKKAKQYLLASYNLRFASIENLSEIALYMQKENLGLDFLQKRNEKIKKVDIKEVNQAAQKYFRPNGYVLVNIGSFEKNKEK